jgi:hypothetical protein
MTVSFITLNITNTVGRLSTKTFKGSKQIDKQLILFSKKNNQKLHILPFLLDTSGALENRAAAKMNLLSSIGSHA